MITKDKAVKISNTDTIKLGALFEDIDCKQYKPYTWTTYKQVHEELDDILTLAKGMEKPNILIEADKGVGKTTLAYEVANRLDCHIVGYSCSSGTREGDLRGRIMNLMAYSNLVFSYRQSRLPTRKVDAYFILMS